MAVDFQNYFPRVEREINEAARALVKKTALEIEADIKSDMTAPKHGRTYKRHGRAHTASAPGEAPAVVTGALVNSVQAEMDGPYAAEIGTPQEQAPILEDELNRPAFKRAGAKAKNTFQRNAQRIR